MRIFKISQTEKQGYDTFDACVVCANNHEEASKIHPKHPDVVWNNSQKRFIPTAEASAKSLYFSEGLYLDEWAENPKDVKVSLIGEGHTSVKKSVVVSSFNAG